MAREDEDLPTPEQVKYVLQQAVLRNYPNPERKGCLGNPVLQEVARLRLPPDDQRWQHISHCSPCYREFLDFRHAFLRRQAREKMLSRLAFAIVGLVIIATPIYWITRDSPAANPSPVAQALIPAVLHLENESPSRGLDASAQSTIQPHRLPIGRLELTIYLPIGSEAGSYQVRLLRQETDTTPLAIFSGTARIENGLTVLRLSPDLSLFEAGIYVFAIQHEDESWRYYRVALS